MMSTIEFVQQQLRTVVLYYHRPRLYLLWYVLPRSFCNTRPSLSPAVQLFLQHYSMVGPNTKLGITRVRRTLGKEKEDF